MLLVHVKNCFPVVTGCGVVHRLLLGVLKRHTHCLWCPETTSFGTYTAILILMKRVVDTWYKEVAADLSVGTWCVDVLTVPTRA
jgi:hypothetical protein